MPLNRLLRGIMVLGLVSGCSQTMVSSQQAAKPTVSVLKTYDWGSPPPITLVDSNTEYSLVDTRIRHAVEQELGARGYTKTTTNQPDFLVAYQATLQKEPDPVPTQNPSQADADPTLLGPTRGNLARQYKQGVLRLSIMEPQGRTLLWQGSARTIISLTTTTEQREERLREAVRKILEAFAP